MLPPSQLTLLLLAAVSANGLAAEAPDVQARAADSTCTQISKQISNASSVIYAQNPHFQPAIHHWYTTSTQTPACVVQVGNAADTATALKIIGSTRTPFAVRSGGHTSNPGFSSTTGVHISLEKLTEITFSPDNSTVTLGMGQTWADVYKKIQGSGYNVVGGRTVGPGLGGFTLGGGFSWKTNQYGLTCDTVKSFNLVLPNATIKKVDASTPDLFFALKGGLNRFGIVTSAEYRTHKQVPQIYGGSAIYAAPQIPAVVNATATFFKEGSDAKSQIITTLEGGVLGSSALVLFFHDGPARPAAFKPFDGIPGISLVKAQPFADFVAGFASNLVTNARGTFETLSTSAITQKFAAAVANETKYYGAQMLRRGGTAVSYDVEPFLPDWGRHATDSAYAHADSPLPLNLYFAWDGAQNDAYWYEAMRASVAHLRAVAIAEGIYPAGYTKYPNYAISGTTREQLYGRNAARLASVRQRVDPANVMGLAGGFDI